MLKILNASPGFGAPLNEQETVDFLKTGKLNIHLGTVDEKGHPNVHPVAYYYDHSNNKLYVLTEKKSMKVRNLRRKETVYFCVDDPTLPYKGVRGKGSVMVHEDLDPNVQALLDELKKGQAVVQEISPTYYLTWDYSRQ